MNQEKKIKLPIIMFFITSIVFALPSMVYLLQNKTIYKFYFVWTYLFKMPKTSNERMINAMLFFALFTILFLIYVLILKKYKQIFKTKKQIIISIIVVFLIVLVTMFHSSKKIRKDSISKQIRQENI